MGRDTIQLEGAVSTISGEYLLEFTSEYGITNVAKIGLGGRLIGDYKGDVTACEKSTTEQKLKCRNALNEVKLKKKNKQAVDDALRSEVNIGSNETVDLDEMEYSFGDLKSPTRFGPLDRFATVEDCSGMGKKKQSNLSNLILKEKMIKVKEYICRWAYECGVPFHAFERDSFKTLLEVVGQFGPRALPSLIDLRWETNIS
ncbi:hypothetical protein Tco_1244515 [Tanacetum coccineum]